MKKTLRLVAVFALMGATLAYTGCTDYSKDFDDINNRIEALESGKLKSVEEQVAGLKSTVASLEDAKKKAEDAIAELQKNSATAADLKALEAKLDAAVKDAASKAVVDDLKKKVESLEAELAKYAKVETLNAEIEKLNKAIADAKALSEKEFASINDQIKAITAWQVEAVATLGAIDGRVKTLEDGLEASQEDIKNLVEGLKSANAGIGILNGEIDAIYDELNTAWDRIRELTLGLKATTAGLAIAEENIATLQTDMAEVKASLKAIKEANYLTEAKAAGLYQTEAQVKEAIKAAIEAALANEGVISTEIAKAVKAATDSLQAQINTIKAELDALKGVVKDIASQIQSIVYVPETTEGKIPASYYYLNGKDKDGKATFFASDIVLNATYEVAPRELVKGLNSENMFGSTVVVKAAPAEVFDVEVISTDEKTGRVEVAISIPAGSDAAAAITDGDDDTNISIALNIVDGSKGAYINEDTYIDAGCKKSSTYVGVKASCEDIANLVYLVKDGKPVVATNNVSAIYDEENTERALFEGYAFMIEIDGELVSLEEAGELLGTTFEITGFDTEITYQNPDGDSMDSKTEKSPVKVEGKGLDMKASVTEVKGLEGPLAIGYSARVNLKNFKLNGADIPGLPEAIYTIKNHPNVIFKYNTVEVPWTWKDGKIYTNRVYSEVSQEVVDIIKKSEDYYEFEAFKTVEGQKAQKYNIARQSVIKASGKVNLGNLEYTPGKETQYQANYYYTDKVTKEIYQLIFEVTLASMPEDKTIDLGTIQATSNFTTDFTEVLAPMTATLTEDADYYTGVEEAVFAAAYLTYKTEPTDGFKVLAGKKEISGASFTFNYADGKETSSLVIPKEASNNESLTISKVVNVFGVKYTYTATVNYTKPSYELYPNPTRVNNGIVKVAGNAVFGSEAYELEDIYLENYFKVKNFDTKEPLQVIFYQKDGKNYKQFATKSVSAEGIGTYKYDWTLPGRTDVIKAVLVPVNAPTVELSSLELTFEVDNVISSFTTEALSGTVVNSVDTKVELATALKVVDYKGKSLVNPNVSALADVWDSKDGTKDYYKVYNQVLTFADQSKIVIKYNGEDVTKENLVKYTYDKANANITLLADNADLIGEVTFEIPVTLGYCFDDNKPLPATVVVTFMKQTEEK